MYILYVYEVYIYIFQVTGYLTRVFSRSFVRQKTWSVVCRFPIVYVIPISIYMTHDVCSR